jgi:tellurite resistance protein TerC
MDVQQIMAWGIFLGFVLAMLAVDLLVLHRKPREITLKEAAIGTLLPVLLAMLFIGAVSWAYNVHFLSLGVPPAGAAEALAESAKYYPTSGGEAALLFFTGYVVELSLSADNVFLFVILMSAFQVPSHLQHRVLFWGVLGALVMRGIMVIAGAALLAQFAWLIYVFGAFLLLAGAKMLFSRNQQSDPSRSLSVRLIRKILPIKPGFDGQRFFTRGEGAHPRMLMGTSLLLVLVCIEFTDLVFALDSIPAIFGITRDPFIVFTSNVFAILGLRSMYFLLAGVMDRFHYLKIGLALVLAFVGVKMVLPGIGEAYGHFSGATVHADAWEIDRYLSLAIIIGVLLASVAASLLFPPKHPPQVLADSGTADS